MANNDPKDTGNGADVAPNTINIQPAAGLDSTAPPNNSSPNDDVSSSAAEIKRLEAENAKINDAMLKMQANNKELLNEKKNERAKRQATEDERQKEQGNYKALSESNAERLKEAQTQLEQQSIELKKTSILEKQAERRNTLDEMQYSKAVDGLSDEHKTRFTELYPDVAQSEDGTFKLSPEERLDRITRFNSAIGSISDPRSLGGGGNAGTVDNSDAAKLQDFLNKPSTRSNNLDMLMLMK